MFSRVFRIVLNNLLKRLKKNKKIFSPDVKNNHLYFFDVAFYLSNEIYNSITVNNAFY